MVAGGGGGCREPGSQGGTFPALSRIIREPEGAWTPGSPRESQGVQNQGKGARNSLYIYVYSGLLGVSAKNQSFVSDNMPYKALRGRITPNFDNSL